MTCECSEIELLRKKLEYFQDIDALLAARYPDIPAIVDRSVAAEREACELRAKMACQLLAAKDAEINRLSATQDSILQIEAENTRLHTLVAARHAEASSLTKEKEYLRSAAENLEISTNRVSKLERLVIAQRRVISKLSENPVSLQISKISEIQ
jgi:hypothetical protein